MATIRRRERTDGKVTFQVRWRDGGTRSGTSRTETFNREADAKKFRSLVDLAGQRDPEGWQPGLGFVTQDQPTGWTVGGWCDHAISARSGITAGTRRGYEQRLAKHLGRLKDIELDDLTRTDVSLWVRDLEEAGLSAKSIADTHGLVSSCLRDAVKDSILKANPSEGLRLPARHGVAGLEILPLSDDEVSALVNAVPEHYRPLIKTLAGTGLRLGEALALHRRHLLLDQTPAKVSVMQSLRREPGGTIVAPPKTKRSVRTLAITPELADELSLVVAGKKDTDFVFTNPTGSRLHAPRFRADVWAKAVEKLRKSGALGHNPRLHDLRHTHASNLIAAGVPLPIIQRRLGHEDISTTVRVYGHLLPDSDDQVLAALSGVALG